MAPPPTPTTLLGLPGPWLAGLVACGQLDGDGSALLSLFRTCTYLRDEVLRLRAAAAAFNVPVTQQQQHQQRLRGDLRCLSLLARHCRDISLTFEGPLEEDQGDDEPDPPVPWTRTEPAIRRLVDGVVAEVGSNALANVKKVQLKVGPLRVHVWHWRACSRGPFAHERSVPTSTPRRTWR